ncbi:MAG: ornithine carbamoyltransferase [Oscillospiraceae bacterium]|nr:ornithine carbamoyltransferase [Oscillospiraceae bacterium]
MNRKEHFLTLGDYSGEELNELLNMADQLKYEQKHGIEHHHLAGKTLGMIFQKHSTRTRVSFESGMYQLGGMAMFLSGKDLQLERGETMQDTARALSGYLDGMMLRTERHEDMETLAEYAHVPVINGRTEFAHPCQVLADLMTVREYKRTFRGKKICYVGAGSNVANSLIVGALKVGMEVSMACPEGYEPAESVLEFAAGTQRFTLTEDPIQAVQGADAVYAGLWFPGETEKNEKNLKKVFSNYQVNDILIRNAKPDAIVLHCLPAHRGQEITAELFETHAKEIFDQSENRLHAQKAVLVRLLGGR